jgi:hypothetical protein
MKRPNWIDWRVDILERLVKADERYDNLSIDQIIDRLKRYNHISDFGGDFEEEELRNRLKLSKGI